MTSRLARNADRVIAIELDRRLAARLREVTAPLGNVEVIESDVLAVDFGALTRARTFRLRKSSVLHYLAHFASPVRARRPDRRDSHRDSA